MLRELAEFGYMKRFCTSVHSSRLVSPFWFPIRSGRSWVGEGEWGWKSCYVIGRGNTATAYLQAGMIRPVPGATADAVVDVQGGSGRRVPRTPKVSCFACSFCRWQNVSDRKNEERSRLDGEKTTQRPIAEGQGSAENLLGGNIIE